MIMEGITTRAWMSSAKESASDLSMANNPSVYTVTNSYTPRELGPDGIALAKRPIPTSRMLIIQKGS